MQIIKTIIFIRSKIMSLMSKSVKHHCFYTQGHDFDEILSRFFFLWANVKGGWAGWAGWAGWLG